MTHASTHTGSGLARAQGRSCPRKVGPRRGRFVRGRELRGSPAEAAQGERHRSLLSSNGPRRRRRAVLVDFSSWPSTRTARGPAAEQSERLRPSSSSPLDGGAEVGLTAATRPPRSRGSLREGEPRAAAGRFFPGQRYHSRRPAPIAVSAGRLLVRSSLGFSDALGFRAGIATRSDHGLEQEAPRDIVEVRSQRWTHALAEPTSTERSGSDERLGRCSTGTGERGGVRSSLHRAYDSACCPAGTACKGVNRGGSAGGCVCLQAGHSKRRRGMAVVSARMQIYRRGRRLGSSRSSWRYAGGSALSDCAALARRGAGLALRLAAASSVCSLPAGLRARDEPAAYFGVTIGGLVRVSLAALSGALALRSRSTGDRDDPWLLAVFWGLPRPCPDARPVASEPSEARR